MKCPYCNQSDKVHSINLGSRVLASTCAFGVELLTGGRGHGTAREVYKNICPKRKFYCERCKREFEQDSF